LPGIVLAQVLAEKLADRISPILAAEAMEPFLSAEHRGAIVHIELFYLSRCLPPRQKRSDNRAGTGAREHVEYVCQYELRPVLFPAKQLLDAAQYLQRENAANSAPIYREDPFHS
jgi:hypothetical protein